MSSPRINGLICFGCIIGYLAVILWGVGLSDNAKSHAICKVRVLLYNYHFSNMPLISSEHYHL